MREFTVHYWCAHWPELTDGLQNGDIINDERVMQLIQEAKVNVMIYHSEERSYCFIDDINHRFQQR